MKLKVYIIITIFLSCLGNIHAQTQRLLSGTVTEVFDDAKEPLIGVNVSVVNSQNRTLTGTVTNINGQYNLKIPDRENKLTIVFSYIGMRSQRINYTGQQQIDIQMENDTKLDDVVVYGNRIDRDAMGISQEQRVSSFQKIDINKLAETSPVVSVDEMLQGQLAGVDITMGSGDPGSRSSIRIRGANTLNASSDPLIVIDGVPYSGEKSEDFDFSNANEEDLGALLNISPADIESVEVLKDAAATAIWGTQGANGVLVINLKKGKVGRTNFSFSTKYTAKIEPRTIPMLSGDEYTALMQESIWNSANYVGVQNAGAYLRLLFDTPEIGYSQNWKYFNEYNQNTDWLNEVRQTGYTIENNFSMNGGGEKATYRVSLGHVKDDGTTIGNSLQRLSASMAITYQFSNKLKFGADFSFTQSDKDGNWASTVRSEAFSKMPNKSPYMIDPSTGSRMNEYFVYQGLNWEGGFSSNSTGSNAKNYNPVAMAKEATNEIVERKSVMTFRIAEFKILPELTYRAWASIGLNSNNTEKFLPQVVTAVAWTSQYANQAYEAYSESLSIQTENKLTFVKNWNDKHNIIANGLFRTSQYSSSKYSSSTSGMASSGMSDPIVGSNVQSIGSGESEGRSLSGTFLLNYTFGSRYVIQGSLSMESNSAMGKNERMGYFPGAGLSWNIQNEPFMKTLKEKWWDDAKLRFSVGQSGRAPDGNSVYLGAYKGSNDYMGMPSIIPDRIQLNNLKWETATEYNYGIDLAFFKGRLRFTGDYYTKQTNDLLRKNVAVPSSTGYSTIKYYNSGKSQSRGWEARADVVILQKGKWTISGNVNFAKNESIIKEMPVNMAEETGVAEGDANLKNGSGGYATRVIEGQPVGAFYGFRYKGVYTDKDATYARDADGNIMNDINGKPIVMKNGLYSCFPGDAMYEDINHDGVINKYDMVYLGNSQPVVTGGAGFNIRYGQFSLNAFFHGRFGQSVINTTRMNNESMYGRGNQSTAVLRRWKNEGDVTDIPRALYNEGLNYLASDRFVEKASFVRLKTLTLNYAIPKNICNRFGITSLGLFATGYNLFTWTNYTGQDPEVKETSGFAMDGATTPSSIRFSFGFNMNF